MALPSVGIQLDEGGGLPLALASGEQSRLELLIAERLVSNGPLEKAREDVRHVVEAQGRRACHQVDLPRMPIRRTGEGGHDHRGDVASIHVTRWGRSEGAV